MKHYEPYKNVNIKVPSELISEIKILAIQKDIYAKDLILLYLEEGVKNEKITITKNIPANYLLL